MLDQVRSEFGGPDIPYEGVSITKSTGDEPFVWRKVEANDLGSRTFVYSLAISGERGAFLNQVVTQNGNETSSPRKLHTRHVPINGRNHAVRLPGGINDHARTAATAGGRESKPCSCPSSARASRGRAKVNRTKESMRWGRKRTGAPAPAVMSRSTSRAS